MRISCHTILGTRQTCTAFEKKHYRFCFPQVWWKINSTPATSLGWSSVSSSSYFFLSFFLFQPRVSPPSLLLQYPVSLLLFSLATIPFSYIFVDVYRLDAVRHKSHYLRIVGSGTRLRGQRDTDERGFSRYLEPVSLLPVSIDAAAVLAHSQPAFNEKPFARETSPRDCRSPWLFRKTDTTRPRIQPFPGQLIAGWASRLVLRHEAPTEEMELILSSLIHLYFQSPASRLPRYSTAFVSAIHRPVTFSITTVSKRGGTRPIYLCSVQANELSLIWTGREAKRGNETSGINGGATCRTFLLIH